MPLSTLGLSAATAGMATLAFAIAAPASAQEPYAHTHYAHTHYHHYHHYAHYGEGGQIIVHSQQPVQVQTYAWGPVGAVGSVVGGTGQAVGAVFYGAGGIVGGVVGGVFGGVSALFGGPGYSYAPATATAARSRRRSTRQAQSPQHRSRWSAALWEGRRPPALLTKPLPATGARVQLRRAAVLSQLGWKSLRSRRLLAAVRQPQDHVAVALAGAAKAECASRFSPLGPSGVFSVRLLIESILSAQRGIRDARAHPQSGRLAGAASSGREPGEAPRTRLAPIHEYI